MEKKLQAKEIIFFENEFKPYRVMAVSERYVVVSRRLNKKEDKEMIAFKVKTGAYCTKDEAWAALKDCPVYSLLDLKEGKRSPDNLVFGVYDYFNETDCLKAIIDLYDGKIELSKRNMADLDIDWTRTNF